jgi:DNA mismatch repair protein MutS2
VVGAEVWIPSLGGKGKVVEAPRKGKVRVALGALGTNVDVGQVRILVGAPRPAPAKRRYADALTIDPAADATDPAQTRENTCDLRGLRAEEALAEGERFLDQMMREGRQCAFLIHGHGTGVLRTMIRERLGKSRYVARCRPGHAGEGGDGVTVFWIR